MAERAEAVSLREGLFLPQITFEGKVFSGSGEGRKFIALPWVTRQIEEKLGFTPYLGTLNIRLTKESALRKKMLEKATKFEILPENNYCTGILFEACVKGLGCAVIQPQIPSYPNDVLEVVAASKLRERFKLEDGSQVSVDVIV